MKTAFSVMTPIYNGEDFVDRCYFMLYSQTFTDWEWVVVNDGSTDRTEERLRAINDPRIKLVTYDQNQGRGHARNQALQAATGDWLVVWDADDIYFPDRLEKANQARLDGYDFCCSYSVLIDNDLRITGYRGFPQDDLGTTRTFMHPSVSFALKYARLIGYAPGLIIGEDTGIILYLAQKCQGQWLQEPVIAYQQVREVNIKKAIASNAGRLIFYERLYRQGLLDVNKSAFIKIKVKLSVKLALLNLFRLWPSLYPKTVQFRSGGTMAEGWSLSAERHAFLKSMRERHLNNDWAISQPAKSI